MSVGTVRVGPIRPLVPGDAVVAGLGIGRSNNNVDLHHHVGSDGVRRLVLAWRTAPTHFASRDARLHVVSSTDDGRTWRHEHTVSMGRDVREPRLFTWQGTLRLAWFSAGTRATRFDPDRIWISEERDRCWSAPVAVSPPDCVVWRIRPLQGRLAMTLYRGAGTLFTNDPRPLTVELWGSDDGWRWEPWNPDRPVVHHGGSEAEFLELPDGELLAVVRKEGPTGGFGSDLCTAPADDPTCWHATADPRKFDSPYLFLAGPDRNPYLVCRRQVAFGGRFAVAPTWLPATVRLRADQLLYWLTPKRTAIYRIDPRQGTATWCGDLPSAGDTAFAAGVELDERRHLVVNYTSPPHHRRWPWLVGQLRPTTIYSVELTIDEQRRPGPAT